MAVTLDIPPLTKATPIDASGTSSMTVVSSTTVSGNNEDVVNASVTVTDTTTGVSTDQSIRAYSGPVSYLSGEFISIGPDTVNLSTTQANVFLKGGSGDDALQVSSGQNVLDGSTGSNFLVGGSGTDTFFVDGRGGGVTWSTIVNFHRGDSATLWGWNPGTSTMTWSENEGTPGFQGATLHASLTGNGHIDDSLTFSGFTVAQAKGFHITTGSVDGNSYLHISA
jgi:serralysin